MIEPEARSMVFWSSWDIMTVPGKVGKNPKRRSEGNEKAPPSSRNQYRQGIERARAERMNSLRP